MHNIKAPLTHIFNLSFRIGCFPQLLKIAKVRPAFKKGAVYGIKNYRPIYLVKFFKMSGLIFYSQRPVMHSHAVKNIKDTLTV
jgi:hypothetical protein